MGAFDSLIDQALPEIHEDVTYREEQSASRKRSSTTNMNRKTRAVVVDVTRFVGRHGPDTHVDYKLSELLITFPVMGSCTLLTRERMVGRAGGLELYDTEDAA